MVEAPHEEGEDAYQDGRMLRQTERQSSGKSIVSQLGNNTVKYLALGIIY